MKKEDFYGKYFLRDGDLKPCVIDKYSWRKYKMTIRYCEYLVSHKLIFDDVEKARIASTNAYNLITGVNNGTYVREEDIVEAPKKPRIYISGPINGHNFVECKERFAKVEEKLIAKGYRVFNPLKNGLPFDADTHKHMRRDLNILTNEDDPFDYIYMMRRWPHSSGCKQELDNAIACGIKVIFEESECAVKFE